jgi:hypothetical protein
MHKHAWGRDGADTDKREQGAVMPAKSGERRQSESAQLPRTGSRSLLRVSSLEPAGKDDSRAPYVQVAGGAVR